MISLQRMRLVAVAVAGVAASGCGGGALSPSSGASSASRESGSDDATSDTSTPAACDTGPQPVALVAGGPYVYAMALDDSYVYLGTIQGVWRVPRTGGTPSLVSGNNEVDALAVDSTRVYWAGFCPESPQGTAPDPTCPGSTALFAASIGGGNYSVLAANTWATSGMLVDSSGIYGSDSVSVWVASPNGGAPRILTDTTVSPQAFALQGDTVYVASLGISTGSIVGIPKAGGPNVTLVAGQAHPGSIAADASGIYWSNWGYGATPGALMRANLDGSDVTTLLASDASNSLSISSVAIDEASVFWTEQATGLVRKMPKSGGAPQVIAQGLAGPNRITTYAGNVYWLAQPFMDASISSPEGGADAGVGAGANLMTACK
jgi:hypothetical protein